jgi:hypothetical protein
MKQKLAKLISIIGHPLLTIPVFVIIVLFSTEKFEKALSISFLIIGCVFVPLILRLYLKSKNGSYTNFDVSDRKQRKSIFIFILPLLIIVTYLLFKKQENSGLCMSVLFATILVFVSQMVNLFIKSSLHVSLNIYLSFLVMTVNFRIGLFVFLFTILLGWSRIVLGRHTLKEVLSGGAIGLTISLLMYCTEGYL